MAHGYLNKFASESTLVYSAGVETHGINADAIKIMAEDGLSLVGHTSNHVDEYAGIDFSLIITVCDNASERCPVFPSTATRLHQNFPDPSRFEGSPEEKKREFRRVRDLIKNYMKGISEEYKL